MLSNRSVALLSPTLLRITVGDTVREYEVEVWQVSSTHRAVQLYRTDSGSTYHVTVPVRRPRQDTWTCDCPAAKHRGRQCKHVLALKAGLRSVGVKV